MEEPQQTFSIETISNREINGFILNIVQIVLMKRTTSYSSYKKRLLFANVWRFIKEYYYTIFLHTDVIMANSGIVL